MSAFALAYKRLHEAFNYRLRTFGSHKWADRCRPTSITLLMTERCNARCVHCDIWQNRDPEETPTVTQWCTVLSDVRRWLGRVQVTFSGGEALMRPFTIDVVRHAVQTGLFVEVLSNGFWRNQERIEQLAQANPWRITISVDGIGPTHSLIRGRDDFFEQTEKSLMTLDRLRREHRLGFKIRLKTVLMRQNLEEACEVARFAGERHGFEVFYQPIEQNYDQAEDPLWFEQSDNWPQDRGLADAVVRRLVSLKREGLPIANSYSQLEVMQAYFRDPGMLRVAVQNHSAHERRGLCSALTTLQIGAAGDVFACTRMPAVGNIKDRPIRQIWEERPRWWISGCCLEKVQNPSTR